jgi:hypothetical protein
MLRKVRDDGCGGYVPSDPLEHIRHARVMHLYLLDVVDYHHPPILRDTRTIRRYVICQMLVSEVTVNQSSKFVAAVGLMIVIALNYSIAKLNLAQFVPICSRKLSFWNDIGSYRVPMG